MAKIKFNCSKCGHEILLHDEYTEIHNFILCSNCETRNEICYTKSGYYLRFNTKIHDMCWIGEEVIIGSNCKIQPMCFIPDNVVIGDRVFVGPCTCFCNDKYPPSHGAWKDKEPTIVEDDVSIGANCTILPNITLGKGCKIGAGSVVTKSVKPGDTVYGNPARPRLDHITGFNPRSRAGSD